MSLTFGLPFWIFLLLTIVGAAGAVWLYRGTVPRVEGFGRTALSTLRFLSLAILAFLLVEPLLTREDTESDPPVVAVLLDDSQSMAIQADDGDSGGAAGDAAALEQALSSGLGSADVRTFRFGSRLSDVDQDADTARYAQGRTDIARALQEVETALEDANLTGVVLVSDGRYNTGRNPLHVADRYAIPVHTVTVGDTTARRDVQVRRVFTNEIAYRGVTLPMDVGIRHEGFGGSRVSVRVMSAGQVLDQAQVDLPAINGETSVRLEVLPDTTGLVRYDVSVSRSDGEFTFRNNVAAVSVLVLESRQRVLMLGGAPGPDLTALHAVVDADEDATVDLFVRKPSGGYYQGNLPDLADYDLLVLSSYPSTGTDLADLDRVAAAISDGIPVFFALGPSTDLRLTQRLGSALPVQPRVLRSGRTEGAPVPTALGTRHPAFEFSPDLPADPWTSLPPLTVTDVSWQTAPDAQVLATISIRGVPLDDPGIVVRRRAGARAVSILAFGTWRWHNLPESLAAYDGVWSTLVANLLQWLSAPEDDRPVRVNPSAPAFEGGDVVDFFGQVYDESAQPVSGAAVDLEVTTPDGATLPFTMRSIGSGRYRAELGMLPEGSYRYTATARNANAELGTDSGTFSVGPLALEYLDTRADATIMRQIALRSGGEAMNGDIRAFIDSIEAQPEYHARTRVVESSTRLWQRYPFLILILLLLTAEWFLRKRRGLV